MDIGPEISHERAGVFGSVLHWLKALMKNLRANVIDICMMTKKVGEEDPRRVIHSLKVGLALVLVSLFYYYRTFYHTFGVSAMWAVMTVVVVFEFSVGATLSKGLNRALATLAAGALGVGAHYLALESGKIGEPIMLAIFVFLQAAVTTFVRFFPKIKARYDYGMSMFILTFCLVSVSGYRNAEILKLVRKRISTIAIGASICVIVSIFVCPVWAGEDLQNFIALNIDKLAVFLLEFDDDYFNTFEKEKLEEDKTFTLGYKTVLNSENIEETLANFARWEPSHGRFMYRHPWKHYLKVGALTRLCAYRIDALHDYLNSEIQMPEELCEEIRRTFTKMSIHSGLALKEVAYDIRTMTKPSSLSESHVANSKLEAENLKILFKSELWRNVEFVQTIQVVTVASILIEIVLCVERIVESVNELALLALFKNIDSKTEICNNIA